MLTIRTIENPEELPKIRDSWHQLWTQSRHATPFQSPHWLIPWWQHFGGSHLAFVAVYETDTLIGAAPFFIYRDDYGVKTLCLMGGGVSDYLDILSLPGKEAPVSQAIMTTIQNQDWERGYLQDVNPESPLLRMEKIDGVTAHTDPFSPCSVIDLPGDIEAFPFAFPGKLRRNVRHAIRELDKTGKFIRTQPTLDTMADDLEVLFSLHQSRWKSRDQEGVLHDAKVQAFHRQAAPDLHRCGMLNFCLFRLNDQPLAAYYTLIKDQCVYVYIGGFDHSLQKYSPGAVGMYSTIEAALPLGIRRADLLRGDETYKALWGVTMRKNFLIRIERV